MPVIQKGLQGLSVSHVQRFFAVPQCTHAVRTELNDGGFSRSRAVLTALHIPRHDQQICIPAVKP